MRKLYMITSYLPTQGKRQQYKAQETATAAGVLK